jgi:NADH dehydrogenase FAD-containing subunit
MCHFLLSTGSYLSIVANQQAKYLAKKMNLLVRDKEHDKSFEFHNAGSLAYIGNW